jgi:hypothetical protein
MTILTSMMLPCYVIISLIIYRKFRNIGGALVAAFFATPFIVLAIFLSFKACYHMGTSLYIPEHNLGLFVSWICVTLIHCGVRIHPDLPDINRMISSAGDTLMYYGIYRYVMLFAPPS